MKKKFSFSASLFFLMIIISFQTLSAQTLDWVRTADSYTKQGAMIARDANDNVVSCGYLIHDRMFTRKWDKLGNFLWEKESVSGIFNYRERPIWIATDNANNIITLGYRYYGTSYQQPNALVILKYAPNGTLMFKKTIEGVFGPSLRCELDPIGNIYIGAAATITGQPDFGFNLIKLDPNGNILFISTHNFGSYFSVNNMRYRNGKIALTGITSLQGYSFNCTTALFDANGNYLWGVVSNILYAGVDVEVDNNGNVYVVNLDYTSGLNGNIQVTKYSVTGTVLFTYFYDNNGHAESPSRINLQPDGNVVISGVSTSPTTGLETFKLSSTGSLMWEAFHSAPYTDIPQLYFMATNPTTSEVFLTGTSSISGNPASIFTIKYDSFGNESWVAKYDSTATRGTGLAIASDGSVFVVGLNWWTVLHYLNGNIPNPCSIPANLSTTGITSVAATFSWSATAGATSYNVRYHVVGTTTWTTGTTTATSFNATGLTANTNYEWQVQTVCSGGISSFSTSTTFTTALAACNDGIQNGNETGIDCGGSCPACPTSCNFVQLNSNNFESGWGIWNDGGADCRRISQAAYAYSGTYSVELRDNTNSSVMTTNNMNLAQYQKIKIKFSYITVSMDNSSEDFWLQVSTNGGSTYMTVAEWNLNDEFVNNQRYFDSVVLEQTFTSTTRFRFRCDASDDNDWVYLDDVIISGCSISARGVSEPVVTDIDENGTLKIFPNPVDDILYIKGISIDNRSNQFIEIYDVAGRKIRTSNISGNSVNVSLLRSGIYFIRITQNGLTIYSGRFIKK
jgi:Secretion system C-terminal sorting domain/Fibronectin type III domain